MHSEPGHGRPAWGPPLLFRSPPARESHYNSAVAPKPFQAPMATEKTWQQWLGRLYNLRRDKRGSHERPHKPVLLLSILDLLDRGHLKSNHIALTPELVKTFRRYFTVVRRGDDQPSIENPFYFLSGDGFWNLRKPGSAPLYTPGSVAGPPGMASLRSAAGQFDPALWGLMQDPPSRTLLRDALVARYFPDQRSELESILAIPLNPGGLQLNEEVDQARSSAFRETILEIYDYTCAACGLRVRLNDGFSLVEAAHLVPFNVSKDDNPNNGLALCPNHHRAMDRFLIAPCPDPKHLAGTWRVGPLLDSRIEGQKGLVELAGQRVIAPAERKFYPTIESLRWREQRLITRY